MTRTLGLLVVLLLLLTPGLARADGGTLYLSRPSGPFVVSLFGAPSPLRVGRADLSVLVQRPPSGEVVLDATVELRLTGPNGEERRLVASSASAQVRLLQAAELDFRTAGRWQIEVSVRRGAERATVSTAVFVDEAAPRLSEHWLALGLPLLGVGAFAWRARLASRRRPPQP